MKARQFYESRIPEITAIVQEGRFSQMINCLVGLGERAAVAAERAALEAAREAARAKKKGKRATKKRRARRA